MFFEQYAMEIVYGVMVSAFWLKIILYLRLSSLLGPLTKMIAYMSQDIFSFLILYAVQLMSFAAVFNILFVKEDSYSTLYDTILTLFSSTLGNFDYSTVTGSATVSDGVG